IPTSVVAACRDEARSRQVQLLCSTPRFRVYTNSDVLGCEVGAALKNVIAIAAGVCDGIGFGDNTKGALLTRGLAESARHGVEMPITQQVCALLFEGREPREALQALMTRDLRSET